MEIKKRKPGPRWGKEAEDPEFRFDYDEEIYFKIHEGKRKQGEIGFPCKPDRTMRKGKTLHKI